MRKISFVIVFIGIFLLIYTLPIYSFDMYYFLIPEPITNLEGAWEKSWFVFDYPEFGIGDVHFWAEVLNKPVIFQDTITNYWIVIDNKHVPKIYTEKEILKTVGWGKGIVGFTDTLMRTFVSKVKQKNKEPVKIGRQELYFDKNGLFLPSWLKLWLKVKNNESKTKDDLLTKRQKELLEEIKQNYWTPVGIPKENPLDKQHLLKRSIYEELAKKAKNPKQLQEIIDHIEKYGEEKFKQRLNYTFVVLKKDLKKIKDVWEIEEQAGNTLTIAGVLAILANLGRLVLLGL